MTRRAVATATIGVLALALGTLVVLTEPVAAAPSGVTAGFPMAQFLNHW